jgi:hypothetical protein
VGRAARAHDAVERREVDLEDVAVEEEERSQRLVLRRGADALAHGEVREEGVDLGLAHLGGMALVVEEDVAARPRDVGLLRAQAVVPRADRVAHAVEQARLSRRGRSVAGGAHAVV